ncbi:MAG: glycosyltransferase family 9 protein [Candidatus Zhuqueibacterota bacterium]
MNLNYLLKKGWRKFWQTALYGIWKSVRIFHVRRKLPENIQHILLLPIGGIGNFIMFTPLITALRARYPNAHFTVIIRSRGASQVIQGYPDCDVIEFNFNNLAALFRFARRTPLPRFDLAFNCETFYGACLAKLSGARFLVSFTYSFGITSQSDFLCYRACHVDHQKHEVDQYFDLYRLIQPTESVVVRDQFFHLDSSHTAFARDFFKRNGLKPPIIGMHIGSLSQVPEKRWPLERFAELAMRLFNDYNASIIVDGGSGEIELASQFQKLIGANGVCLNIVNLYSLKQSAAIIQRCSLFISNDSGPMHMAAAVGTPTIGIFGPTNPAKNRPWGDPAKMKVVRVELPCSPCYKPFSSYVTCTNPNYLECMKNISVDMVFTQAKILLEAFSQNSPTDE